MPDEANMKKVVILGSTGSEIVKLLDARRVMGKNDIHLLGFLDDNQARHGSSFMGLPVLGGSELLRSTYADCWVINNVARTTSIRWKVWRKLQDCGARFYTAIHPMVDTAYAQIGEGSIVQEGVILGPETRIGSQSLVSFGVIAAHESEVGECCFISPGVCINGRIKIEMGAFIGSGAIILPDVTVGAWSMVGAGSVVTNDVPPYSTVFGAPARVIAVRKPEEGVE
ncbi:MAG: NeuD/PglB/VioB family sugar acetyltransferase [Terracidiphilus sp.]|jgi:sugar O-acyltransferase (sialic acid O-acetyltransferase NeuD family)